MGKRKKTARTILLVRQFVSFLFRMERERCVLNINASLEDGIFALGEVRLARPLKERRVFSRRGFTSPVISGAEKRRPLECFYCWTRRASHSFSVCLSFLKIHAAISRRWRRDSADFSLSLFLSLAPRLRSLIQFEEISNYERGFVF